MAKSKALIASEHVITALENRTDALEARLVVATEVYRNQRARIAELEALLNTRGVIATQHVPAPIVTRFTNADGSVWEKTRLGNRASAHQVA